MSDRQIGALVPPFVLVAVFASRGNGVRFELPYPLIEGAHPSLAILGKAHWSLLYDQDLQRMTA
jgi:hypothetical protein